MENNIVNNITIVDGLGGIMYLATLDNNHRQFIRKILYTIESISEPAQYFSSLCSQYNIVNNETYKQNLVNGK